MVGGCIVIDASTVVKHHANDFHTLKPRRHSVPSLVNRSVLSVMMRSIFCFLTTLFWCRRKKFVVDVSGLRRCSLSRLVDHSPLKPFSFFARSAHVFSNNRSCWGFDRYNGSHHWRSYAGRLKSFTKSFTNQPKYQGLARQTRPARRS